MADESTLPKLRVELVPAMDFRTGPVTGAFGGMTPQGMVHVTFWHDRGALPEVQVFEQGTNKELERFPKFEEEVPIQRVLEFSALMTPDIADKIGKWLQEKAEQFRAQVEKANAKTEH